MLSVEASGNEIASDFWMSRTQRRLLTTDGVTAFSSMDVMDTARQHIDTELEAMHIAFSLMQARRNRLSSISLLAPEVLLNVFAFLAVCDPPVWHDDRKEDRYSVLLPRPPKPPYSVIGWIRVTHVCRLWRDAALAQTQLWSTVSSISPNWTLEMVSRVKDMPFNLQVCFGRTGKTNDSVYAGILGQGRLARLKALTLYNYSYHQENSLSLVKDLTSPAPLVESLSLSDWREWWSDGCQLPADLFGGAAPRLRSIYLHHWTFASWDAPYLQDLTTLKVTFPEKESDGARLPTVLQILRVLKRMPRLQILTLENILNPTFDDGLPRSHRLVPLAHLSRMRLRCEAAQCVFLMSGLTALPIAARLSLSLTGPRQDLRNVIPMLRPFSMPIDDDPYDPLTYASLDCSKEYGNKTIEFLAASKSSLGHQRGKISLSYQPPDVRWSATLQRLFTELCLGEVEVLDLSGNELYRLTMKGFQVAFGPMKAVRELRLGKKAGRVSRNGGIVGLIEALALPAPRPKTSAKRSRASTAEEEQEHPLLFPELDCLTLTSMNLASRKAAGETTYHEVLLEVLEARCTFGVPLQRLILKDCTYKESWLAMYGGYSVNASSQHPGRVLDENFQIPHSTYLML